MTKQKFTLNIDKETLKTLKIIAIKEDVTVTKIVTSLIEDYNEEYKELNKE